MHNLRVVDISHNDGIRIIATFCGSEGFNKMYLEEPSPMAYSILEKSRQYIGFKTTGINQYKPHFHDGWFNGVDLYRLPEYTECTGQTHTFTK